MNSLTTLPSQHAFKASTTLLSGPKPSRKFTDPGFRTYNPDVFPSLSPFSTFYNKKKQNEARACRNCSDDLEPVKKCKLEDGTSKVVPPPSGKLSPSSISSETKAIDKDCFRVPSLPKRLCEKKGLLSRAKVAPIGNFNSATKESTGKDDTMKNHQRQEDVKFSMETVQEVDNPVLQQDNGNFSPMFDASLLNNLYERFKLEFLFLRYSQQNNHSVMKNFEADNYETSEMNMEERIARSKDLLKEQIKKTEIGC